MHARSDPMPARRLSCALAWTLLLIVSTLSLPGALAKPDRQGEDPSGRAAPSETTGRILLPTLSTHRPFTPGSGHGITHWVVDPVRAGEPFRLKADDRVDRAGSCPGTLTCIHVPNFDIVFYASAGSSGMAGTAGTYNEPGDEKGTVPSNAKSAIIFLRYGPGSAHLGGTAFTLTQGVGSDDGS